VHPQASLDVFERDCLIQLGTCVAAAGTGKAGRPCFRFALRSGPRSEAGEMACGELRLVPLAAGETATLTVDPERGFDCGAGPGHRVEREVRGGTVGLILDARGRPLGLPDAGEGSRAQVRRWVEALDLYPDRAATAEVPT
jgi:hypothetical protein